MLFTYVEFMHRQGTRNNFICNCKIDFSSLRLVSVGILFAKFHFSVAILSLSRAHELWILHPCFFIWRIDDFLWIAIRLTLFICASFVACQILLNGSVEPQLYALFLINIVRFYRKWQCCQKNVIIALLFSYGTHSHHMGNRDRNTGSSKRHLEEKTVENYVILFYI